MKMELKALILGLVFSMGAFAVKNGGGLSYVFLQTSGIAMRIWAALLFMAGYALLFAAAAAVLVNIDLMANIDVLQAFFKSGMTLHFILALLLMVWGIHLLKGGREQSDLSLADSSLGWIPMVVPCPVCFIVILLSSSFLNSVYPGNTSVFFMLYLGFIFISLVTAFIILKFVRLKFARNRDYAGRFLGILMTCIAVYFFLSVIVIPSFADLDKIYRIASPGMAFELSKAKIIVLSLCTIAFITGFYMKVFIKPR